MRWFSARDSGFSRRGLEGDSLQVERKTYLTVDLLHKQKAERARKRRERARKRERERARERERERERRGRASICATFKHI